MDLIESIKIFKRVAESESFSAVASEFNVTQPTISKTVAALEARLDVALFRRSTRGLSLTTEGQKLFLSTANVLDQLEVMLAAVKNEKLLLQGQLRVTATFVFARLVLAPLLMEFSEMHPELKFNFQLSDGFVDLVENKIDIAVRIGELPDSSLKALKIGVSRRALYASSEYVKKHGLPESIEDLRNHRCLYNTRHSDRAHWIFSDSNGKAKAFYFEPYFQTDGADLIRESVIKGVGVALLPTWMMIEQEKAKKVVKFFDKHINSPVPISIVSSGNQEMTAKQRAFTDFFKQKFAVISALSLREK